MTQHDAQADQADGSAEADVADVTRRRIGLFGGTFDPPHLGHLVVADQVRSELDLDECWFVVANDPWQKSGWRTVTPASKRLEMVEAALDGFEGLRACDVELEEAGPSYTIDTLTTLQERLPDVDWLIVIGQDAASRLDTWERAERLRSVGRFIVVNRPGAPSAMPPGWHLERVDVPPLDISSTDLRTRFGAGRSVRFLVPDPVIDLVDQWGIYRPES